MPIVIAIDASRNRSGGAIAHLKGILSNLSPEQHGIQRIHIWSFRALLDELPDYPWLIKHNPNLLEGSLVEQVFWQSTLLSAEVKSAGCDILFSTDASTLCRFMPLVVLSQDMLSYEPGVMQGYGYGYERFRLELILILQNLAFQRAAGVIFLTQYAGSIIQKSCGLLTNVAYIPHGVDSIFSDFSLLQPKWPSVDGGAIECIYVSNVDRYKNQWNVVRAVALLRARGYNVTLTLVGGGSGPGQTILQSVLAELGVNKSFVTQMDFIDHGALPALIRKFNIFVYASSCENMPVTLLEGMSMGLPIASSDRGPMPEILLDGGVYFDPENPMSIASSLESLILSRSLCAQLASQSKKIAQQYKWQYCANKTFEFIVNTAKKSRE